MLDKHYVLFDDVTRIPLIVHAPGQSHYKSDALVSGCLDTEATIRRLLSLPKNENAHGKALPLCAQEDADRREYITSSANGQQFRMYCSRMISDGRFKYIWNMTDMDEFYDLNIDPGEKENLIDSPVHCDRISAMRKSLHAELIAHEDPFIGKGWLDRQLLDDRQHTGPTGLV